VRIVYGRQVHRRRRRRRRDRARPRPGERPLVPDNGCPGNRRVRPAGRCGRVPTAAGHGGQPTEGAQDSERRATRPEQQPVRGRPEDGTFRRPRQLLHRDVAVAAVRVDRRALRRGRGFRTGTCLANADRRPKSALVLQRYRQTEYVLLAFFRWPSSR